VAKRRKPENQPSSEGSTENPSGQQTSSLKLLPINRTRKRELPFISMGIRFRVNVEALNMVESAGNLTKHRVVPIVIYRNGKYSLKWYPALSGETLAHAIQANLALLEKKANGENAELCYFCGLPEPEFIKHTFLDFFDKLKDIIQESDLPKGDLELLNLYAEVKKEIDKIKKDKNLKEDQKKDKINQILESKKKDIEEKVVKNCIVEDIGGFLITKGSAKIQLSMGMLRRTSAFQVSYAIPSEDSLEEASTTDIQMQVRMAPTGLLYAKKLSANEEKSANEESNEDYSVMLQTPYNKEIASTTYSFIFNFDADKVGISALTNSVLLDNNERIRRAKLLLDALKLVLDGQFGASKSRYHPFMSKEFILAAVSKGDVLFTVSSPAMKLEDFIEETIERAAAYVKEFGIDIKIYAWIDSSFDEKFSNNNKLSEYISNTIIAKVAKKYGEVKDEQGQKSPTEDKHEIKKNIIVKAQIGNVKETILPITIIISRSHAHLIEKLKEEIEGKQVQNQ